MTSSPLPQREPSTPAAGTVTRDRLIRRLRRAARVDGAAAGGESGPDAATSEGLTANSLTSTEQSFLKELDWWVAEHGHAEVPQSATSRPVAGQPYRLGDRVARARMQYHRGELPHVLLEELQRRPGWSWSVLASRLDDEWRAQAAELHAHLREHGSLEGLPLPLQRWLRAQRRQHAAGRLAGERLDELEQIPGALMRGDTAVPSFIAAARAWLADAPDRSMLDLRVGDVVEVDGHQVPLGRQATYYRRRYHGLEGSRPLPASEQEAIAGLPGWSWELRRPGRPKGARNRQHASSSTSFPSPSSSTT